MKKILAILMFFSSQAFAQQTATPPEVDHQIWDATIKTEVDPSLSGIPFLTWDTDHPKARSQGDLSFVDLYGKLSQNVQSLSLNGKKVTVKSDGTFGASLGFQGTNKTFVIAVVTQDGANYSSRYHVTDASNGKAPIKYERFHTNFGLGLTEVKYAQTDIPTFNETELTVKGAVTYALKPNKWDLGLSAFLNFATLHSSSPDYSIRFLGVNLRLGYHLLPVDSKFQLNLDVGAYYNTSFSTIGFKNMLGPQLYPELIYQLPNQKAIFTYFKYSPVFVSSSSLDMSHNREIASGIYYSFPVLTRSRFSVGFDFSKLDIAVDGLSSNTQTYSLSASIAY